jgi:hypothetical protein
MNDVQVFGEGFTSRLTPLPAPLPAPMPAPLLTSRTPLLLKIAQNSNFGAPVSPAIGFPMQQSNSMRKNDLIMKSTGYTRAEGKRKADDDSDAPTAKRLKDASHPSATIAYSLEEKVDGLLELCRLLLRRDLANDDNLSQDADIRLRTLFKEIDQDPTSAIAKLHQDLESSKREVIRYADLARKLIVERELGRPDQFPLSTDLSMVEGVWTMVMQSIKRAVELINQEPETLPSPTCAALLTTAMELIASGGVREEKLAAYLKTLGSLLQGPRAVQALMGALYCRWTFQNPEPMVHDEYSSILTKTYETLAVVGM